MARPRKPLLIVPVRDRRQKRRILTIRNVAVTMLSGAVLFAAFSIVNERRRAPEGDYGRLFGTQVTTTATSAVRTIDVVTEGPVADQPASDPMLVAPAAREQLLLANTNVPATTTTTTTVAPVPVPRVPVMTTTGGHGTTIVGDGTGVAVVKAPATSTAPRPVLAGGIFKQQ